MSSILNFLGRMLLPSKSKLREGGQRSYKNVAIIHYPLLLVNSFKKIYICFFSQKRRVVYSPCCFVGILVSGWARVCFVKAIWQMRLCFAVSLQKWCKVVFWVWLIGAKSDLFALNAPTNATKLEQSCWFVELVGWWFEVVLRSAFL